MCQNIGKMYITALYYNDLNNKIFSNNIIDINGSEYSDARIFYSNDNE